MQILRWIVLLSFAICSWQCQESEPDQPSVPDNRPNILLILADDLGYSDLGCYGGEINTPHIDALAQGGVRFTQMYNSARCCPSRASLLTGLYPHQAGIGSFAGSDKGAPGYRGKLNEKTVTIAELLREAGYRTFGSGKWHVNTPGPTERGFEEFYGFLEDYGIDGYDPKWMKRYPAGRPERVYAQDSFFATNAITDYALDFLDSAQTTPDLPWFLYLAYQAPHFPLQAPAADIARYETSYLVGWDTIRQRRYDRLLQMGLIDTSTKLSPRSPFVLDTVGKRNQVPGDGIHNPPWQSLSRARQADLAKRMAVYAGMVDNMDQNIGRVTHYLASKGELENTLILFLSDNGACGEWDAFGFEFPENNTRVAGSTPGHPNILHRGQSLAKLGSSEGPLFSYGSGWANVGNTPFSYYKMFVHEGGISTPFIMHWPAGIHSPGRIFNETYAHIMDIMPTCMEVAKAKYPDHYDDRSITPTEGVSLLSTLDSVSAPKRLLIFEHAGHPAVREGDWKLVSSENAFEVMTLKRDTKYHLYNIARDRSETTDLAEAYPDLRYQLHIKMLNEFRRTFVLPKPRY